MCRPSWALLLQNNLKRNTELCSGTMKPEQKGYELTTLSFCLSPRINMANHGWCLLKQQDSHGDSDSPANTNDGWQNHQKQGIQSFRGSMALPTPPCQISILKSCGTVGLCGGFFNLSVCGGDAVTVAVTLRVPRMPVLTSVFFTSQGVFVVTPGN